MMKVWRPKNDEIVKTGDWGEWNKEESVFPWQYSERETCYILEGEAEVFDDRGNSIKFGKGDMVQFEKGLSCEWKITKAIRKRYIFG